MDKKISSEIIPAIYETCKKVYEGKMSASDGALVLFGTHKMNINSAKSYIGNFKLMMQGKQFKRTLNAYSTDYLIARIKADYGMKQFDVTLISLKAHILYYESCHHGELKQLRAIHRKHVGDKTDM